MKVRKLIDSLNYAIDGIIYTLKTQRNMRIHYVMAVIVLSLSLLAGLSKMEMLVLFFTITLVIIAEMINTSIEAAIDLITDQYHELAKIAKNVAAGAVLIAAGNAIIVGYILFFQKIDFTTTLVIHKVREMPIHVTFSSLILVVFVVVGMKAYVGKGTPLRGGMPSGHTAIAFSILVSIGFVSENTLAISLCFLMALLVAQSRIEAGIHDAFEVLMGAILGFFVTVFVFQVIY